MFCSTGTPRELDGLDFRKAEYRFGAGVENMSFQPLMTAYGPLSAQGSALCWPLMAKTGDALIAEICQAVAAEADVLEWRVDALESLAARAELLSLAARVREAAGALPLILTLRAPYEGGCTEGLSDAMRADLLLALLPYAKPEFIDLELAMSSPDFLRVRSACRAVGIQLIVSSHDFAETPTADALRSIFARARDAGGDVAKLATYPKDFSAVLRLMSVTREAATQLGIPVVGIAMGELGVVSRVFATECGSALTFIAGSEASAPGQVSLTRHRQLRALLPS
jgi:3-dehydroquinate dehydratase I